MSTFNLHLNSSYSGVLSLHSSAFILHIQICVTIFKIVLLVIMLTIDHRKHFGKFQYINF